MTKSVKLADIAQKVGVSVVTVSKALSDQKGVSEEMRERIKKLAEEMGYRPPSAVKKESAKPRSYNIGVLIEEEYLDNYESFYWKIYQQISIYALQHECFAMMEVVSSSMEEQMELPKLVRERKAHGIIVLGRMPDAYLKLLKEDESVPVVYIDFTDDDPDSDAVVSDSYYGACRLVNYLIGQGHTRIAYVGTLLATSSITDRYFGYAKALMEHDIPQREDWRLDDRHVSSGFIQEGLMQIPEEMPTAFFCNCDLTAGKLIQKLRQGGYQVPEDISVVGFDNYIYPGVCDLGITTYEVDQAEMAAQAVKILIKRMGNEADRPRTYMVEGRIVVKDSVKKIES